MEEAEDRVKGLIIDEPHISNILNGAKDWEIRNRFFPYKIPKIIGLLTKKNHTYPHSILGYAEVTGCYSMTPPQMLNYNHRHQASDFIQRNPNYMKAKILYAYELGDVWRLPTPDPYNYKQGQVVWVDI